MAYGASLVPGSRLVGSDFGLDISSVLVIRSVSGDPGFAWMAFPVKFRVVSSVGSWP